MPSETELLFSPFRLGDLKLKNRLVMAPLTRNRATKGTDAPRELNAEYYRQRSGAGLIITEATQISQQGQGYIWTPGLYTEAQVEGWKLVTDTVHAAAGRIFVQLWHVGRISHVSLQPGNAAPVAPSAIQAKTKTFIETGFADVSMPRALESEEIPLVVRDYLAAAENAQRAGFDGVEVHAANGYLLEQFLRDSTNTRTDAYGGSIENRARLTLEVVDALLRVYDRHRVGIRISPVTPANDAPLDSHPQKTYGYLVEELGRRGIGYIHVVEGATGGPRDNAPFDYETLRRDFPGAYIANNGYTKDLAIDALRHDRADLIAFGKLYIANPDLDVRLRTGAALNEWDKASFYGGDAKGYTDYPSLSGSAAAAAE
jgi:N-ethylmaleimide reductase